MGKNWGSLSSLRLVSNKVALFFLIRDGGGRCVRRVPIRSPGPFAIAVVHARERWVINLVLLLSMVDSIGASWMWCELVGMETTHFCTEVIIVVQCLLGMCQSSNCTKCHHCLNSFHDAKIL